MQQYGWQTPKRFEQILGSKAKSRVIEILLERDQILITHLAHAARIQNKTCRAVVNEFQTLGITRENPVGGKFRLIQLDDQWRVLLHDVYNRLELMLDDV